MLNWIVWNRIVLHLTQCIAQSAGVVEYADCISPEGLDSSNEFPGYDINQYDGVASLILGLWEMRSTPSLPLLPGPLWPELVAPEMFHGIGQIELFHI